MVTPLCRTREQIPIINETSLINPITRPCCVCPCPCQLSPPINEYTYCVLKKICRKILKEIHHEQQRERYSVFDGGNSMKYENIVKATRDVCRNSSDYSRLSDRQRLSVGSLQKVSRRQKLQGPTRRATCRGSSDSQMKKSRGSKDKDIKNAIQNQPDKSAEKNDDMALPVVPDLRQKVRGGQKSGQSQSDSAKDKSAKDTGGKGTAEKDKLGQDKPGQEKSAKDKNDRDYSGQAKSEKRKSSLSLEKSRPKEKPSTSDAGKNKPSEADKDKSAKEKPDKTSAKEKPAKEKPEKPVRDKPEKPVKEKPEKPAKEKPPKEKPEKPAKEKLEKPVKVQRKGSTSERQPVDKKNKNQLNDKLQSRKAPSGQNIQRRSAQNGQRRDMKDRQGSSIVDLERDFFTKRRGRCCGTMQPPFDRYENPCTSRAFSYRPRYPAMSRVDAIRPCDYLRAQMEDRDRCFFRICDPCCPPCTPCPPCPPCRPCSPRCPNPCDPCNPCQIPFVRCVC